MMMRRNASHCLDDFFAELHWWRHGFWIASENITKIDVEQFSGRCQQHIVRISFADAQ